MHIKIEIDPLGKKTATSQYPCAKYRNRFTNLLYDAEQWRRENPYASIECAQKSTIMRRLNKYMRQGWLNEKDYNDLVSYLHTGHLQSTKKNQRVGLSNIDLNGAVTCFGKVHIITNETLLLRNIRVFGMDKSGNPMFCDVRHMWIRLQNAQHVCQSKNIQLKEPVKFTGKLHQYVRQNNTKDFSVILDKIDIEAIERKVYRQALQKRRLNT